MEIYHRLKVCKKNLKFEWIRIQMCLQTSKVYYILIKSFSKYTEFFEMIYKCFCAIENAMCYVRIAFTTTKLSVNQGMYLKKLRSLDTV